MALHPVRSALTAGGRRRAYRFSRVDAPHPPGGPFLCDQASGSRYNQPPQSGSEPILVQSAEQSIDAAPLLQAVGLGCERDDRTLFRRLDFAVQGGELLEVRGRNGSGKTTLLRMVAGLGEPDEGELRWRGRPLRRMRAELGSELCYLGHLPAIKETLTARENLRFAMQLKGCAASERIDLALAESGLRGFEDLPCRQLSAGQRRRVALALLRLLPARLWILDEPFTALDRQAVAQLEQWIEAHRAQGGAVLLTTHQPLGLGSAWRTLTLGESVA